MRWSKVRSLVRDRFAPALRDRLDIHSAAYGACSCGHAWMTLDGVIIANFCTRAWYIAQGREPGSADRNTMYASQLLPFGAMSRQDAYQSCWAFLHDLAIGDALASDDPLVQALAVADVRVGQRSLAKLDFDRLHPLARRLATDRLAA